MAARLFDPRGTTESCSHEFLQVQGAAGYAPARRMAERVFEDWIGRRTEFRRDFRTHGFSARLWELSLFGYFSEQDFAIDTNHSAPDFLVSRNGLTVAVEATTTNPPRNEAGAAPRSEREALPHIPSDALASADEQTFQLAKALRRKISPRGAAQRPYWEAEHVAGGPFVIAVAAFHGETSLFHSDSGLASYLYGHRWTGERHDDGTADFWAEPIADHEFGGKTIPSRFFFQPGNEHVSAVIFSNSATISQFQRMGVEYGFAPEGMRVIRRGMAYDDDPSAVVPIEFEYLVEAGKHRESFATGLSVLHNPVAVHPIPDDFFRDALESRLSEDGFVETHGPAFVPYASVTEIYTVT
jgi:hypothetical protein